MADRPMTKAEATDCYACGHPEKAHEMEEQGKCLLCHCSRFMAAPTTVPPSANVEYRLVLSFDDQSPSFALGYECGSIDGRMISGESFNTTVHSVNKTQIEAIAKLRDYACEWSFVNDDWLNLSAETLNG